MSQSFRGGRPPTSARGSGFSQLFALPARSAVRCPRAVSLCQPPPSPYPIPGSDSSLLGLELSGYFTSHCPHPGRRPPWSLLPSATLSLVPGPGCGLVAHSFPTQVSPHPLLAWSPALSVSGPTKLAPTSLPGPLPQAPGWVALVPAQ
jgi:hypothetical protein